MPRFVLEDDEVAENVEIEMPDGEVFTFVPECPAGLLIDLAKLSAEAAATPDAVNEAGEKVSNGSGLKVTEAFIDLMSVLAVGDTAERFTVRLRDPKRPISSPRLTRIIQILMEAYGDRPTEPSSTSSDSSEPAGTGSTDEPSEKAGTPDEPPSVES